MGAHVFLLKSDSLCFVPFIGPLSPSVCVFNISGQVFLSIIVIEGYKSMVSSDNGELVFLVVCFIEVEKKPVSCFQGGDETLATGGVGLWKI